MRKIATLPIFFVILLVACTKIGQQSSNQLVQTEVARQLTAQVASATPGEAVPAETLSSPTSGVLPTVTPTETPLPSPTSTLTPSSTPPLDDPVLSLGGATWREDFNSPDALYTYDDGDYRFAYQSPHFIITGLDAGGYDAWVFAVDQIENYYLEMTAAIGTCSGYDRYGMLVGVPYPANNPSFLFRVACDGLYSFGYYDTAVDKNFHFLIPWTRSSSILSGSNQTNRLGVKTQGTRIMLYANGHFLAETDAPGFGKGRFGVFAASPNTAGMEVRISSLAYWLLD